MPKIIELDKHLINKIAAGEVIERPASVVKELIENSMDAGATSITIEIKEGGKSLIRITDNGLGIEKDDLAIAVKSHTTSKLLSADDLFNISTLGFRGEALASIGAVSYLKIISKIKESSDGQMIEVEDGRILLNKPTASNTGTIVEVNNLFFNVPARKKHMKSIASEFKYIVDIVTRYILANPLIHFKLIHNDSLAIDSPSTTDTLANVATVYGRAITKSLISINFSFFDMEIMGFASRPDMTRGDRTYQSIFVNKRYVRDSLIQKAVYDAYGALLFHGRHPIFILDIKIEPKKIDVNVHPQKYTIRIEKEQEMYHAVKNAVLSAMMEQELMPLIDEIKTKGLSQKVVITNLEDFGKTQSSLKDLSKIGNDNSKNSLSSSGNLKEEKEGQIIGNSEKGSNNLKIRLIGKLHNTYILGEDNDGLLLIDQHAAHERVLFEKFLKEYKNEIIQVQELISPIVFEANPHEKIIIDENIELFKKMAILIEPFGKTTYVIRALPSILSKQQTPAIINDIIDEMNNNEYDKLSKIKEERIAMAACRSAVKAYDVLEMPQIQKLLEDLFKCENSNTCPHGRPIIICFPIEELEKKFKRRV
ncbi:DNA mismatch repair endonuclease MutL [Candidatus Woesearchaeota archaeon]|nr:DNA mismatch repair endonuclease MutL [Candidatus Woesearchaeota archaeon]